MAFGVTAGFAFPWIVGGVLVAINGAASAGNDADSEDLKGKAREDKVLKGAVTAVIVNTVTLGVGKSVRD